jgi:hypothetical protein
MTTKFVIKYAIYRCIRVSKELAKKLRENENTEYGLPYSWVLKSDTLYYFDADGNKHEIEAEDDNEGYEKAEDIFWEDDDEEED